ncbi:GTPase ObgE [Borrelia sp. A-FGy1]|uniref:GTPase ObgE n=1 Tax=Borrelia sp. A-FGy1 TaxID=2608247 RepID=UPI0015F78404|nr:GTPase ObgE [Borrelia sp. A-FGy1]QMU99525.1 GTPase ObgE [Borrelia sp. A-FGy1]
MHTFKDVIYITVSSGDGGAGCVSFLRERFKAKGGPDGGDGGRGGNVVFRVKDTLKTLSFYKNGQRLFAKSGKPGMGFQKKGANGEDLVLFVPSNTSIYDSDTGSILFKLLDINDEFIVLRGGRGGLGNSSFKNSTRRAPRYAQPGEKGITLNLRLELSLIADIGLVGLPNSGKSSLISRITSSRSKSADYSFTTKIPHLGVLKDSYYDLVIVDIPGIIRGSSRGVGLGFEFLRHISKASGLVFLIDVSSDNFLSSYNILINELGIYGSGLLDKRRIIVANKLDLEGAEKNFEQIKKVLEDKGEKVLGISIYEDKGIKELIREFFILLGNKKDNFLF